MNKFLVKHLIPNYEKTKDSKVRTAYGTLGSIVGILCNLLLFLVKFLIGTCMHSVAITADGFNNLSDCLTCIVALLGYYVSNKPADEDHPFGHGRVEYIFSFLAAFSIFFVAFELVKESVHTIWHPVALHFQLNLLFVLVLSIFVKVWMASFYGYLAKETDNSLLYASSQDSKNDVLTTSITVLSLLIHLVYPNIPVSGIVGVFVGIVIFKSGYELASDIVDRLIGKPVDRQLVNQIETMICQHAHVIGVHDLVIHDYGAGVKIGSGHVELNSTLPFVEAHTIVDTCEREIKELLAVSMTLHMDPVELDNPEREKYYNLVQKTLQEMDCQISLHDFRILQSDSQKRLAFDLLVPYTCSITKPEFEAKIQAAVGDDVTLAIEVDHSLFGKEEI